MICKVNSILGRLIIEVCIFIELGGHYCLQVRELQFEFRARQLLRSILLSLRQDDSCSFLLTEIIVEHYNCSYLKLYEIGILVRVIFGLKMMMTC